MFWPREKIGWGTWILTLFQRLNEVAFDFPRLFRRERPWMPSLCPGFGHQSTGRVSGNNFRAEGRIHRTGDHRGTAALRPISAIEMNFACARKRTSRVSMLGVMVAPEVVVEVHVGDGSVSDPFRLCRPRQSAAGPQVCFRCSRGGFHRRMPRLSGSALGYLSASRALVARAPRLRSPRCRAQKVMSKMSMNRCVPSYRSPTSWTRKNRLSYSDFRSQILVQFPIKLANAISPSVM